MEPASAGERVKVASGGPQLDGIVFDTPSRSKVAVAVVEPDREPVFRTVHPNTLTERTEESRSDRALRLLVRRGRRRQFAVQAAAGWLPAGRTPVTRVPRCIARPASSAALVR